MLWACFRVAAVFGGYEVLVLFADLEGTARPSALPMGSVRLGAALAFLVAGVTLAEMARRSELLFLANLGWSKGRLAATALAICLGLEVCVQLILVW